MKLTCPSCGAELTLDQATKAGELVALSKAMGAFGEDWPLVKEYLECFRRKQEGTLLVTKRLRLGREVYEIWKNGQFKFEKESYRVSREGLKDALRQMANRELTGLMNHNYLKKILAGTARTESQERERELREREARLMGGDRGNEGGQGGLVPPGTRRLRRDQL